MGEIADDMIDGTSCELCGCYFIDPQDEDKLFTHGHPAVCKSCWNGLTKDEKKNHQRAIADTL